MATTEKDAAMICALVLAAGRSERMGTQKLLLPIAGKPVVTRIIDELQQCALQKTLVVVGRDAEKIRLALAGRAVELIQNPEATGDMLSSIRCGLQHLPDGCEAVLIVLCDQPNLTAALVGQLIRAFSASRRGIIVPSHGGHRGHPVLISTHLSAELVNRHFESGLRDLLELYPQEVLQIQIPDADALADMDTPADYQMCLNERIANSM